MNDIISRIIPIVLLISIGSFMRYKKALKEETVYEMKKFVVNYCLSAFLFITFVNIVLKKEHYYITIITIIMQCAFFGISLLLNKIKSIHHPLLPYVTSGTAFGFIGIPLFNAIFGAENIDKFSILAIGHEFYLWLVLYAQMSIRLGKNEFSIKSVLALFKTPTVISITLGILLNILGFNTIIKTNGVLKGIYTTIEYLSTLSIPLIIIIIGYGLKINEKYMKESTKLLLVRMAVMLIIGYAFKYFIIDNIIQPDAIFDYAFLTFLITAPPLSLPLLVSMYSTKENEELANNLIVLSTIVTIALFVVLGFFV